MSYLTGDGAPEALNQLAREQTKLRLLQDIHFDLAVCEIEGWEQAAYLRELHDLIAHFDPCERRSSDGSNTGSACEVA